MLQFDFYASAASGNNHFCPVDRGGGGVMSQNMKCISIFLFFQGLSWRVSGPCMALKALWPCWVDDLC